MSRRFAAAAAVSRRGEIALPPPRMDEQAKEDREAGFFHPPQQLTWPAECGARSRNHGGQIPAVRLSLLLLLLAPAARTFFDSA